MRKIFFLLFVFLLTSNSVWAAGRFTGVGQLSSVDNVDHDRLVLYLTLFVFVLAIFVGLIWWSNVSYKKKKQEKKDRKQENQEDPYFKANKYVQVVKSAKVKNKYKGKKLKLAVYMRIDSSINKDNKFNKQYLQCIKYIDKNSKLQFGGRKYVFQDICRDDVSLEKRPGFQSLLEATKEKEITGILVTDLTILSSDKTLLSEMNEIFQKNEITVVNLY